MINKLLLTGAMMIALFPGKSFAEAPENTFKFAVEKMKSAGSIEPLVDFVDWSLYYDSLSPEEKRGLGFRSGDAMREYYRNKAKVNGQDRLDK